MHVPKVQCSGHYYRCLHVSATFTLYLAQLKNNVVGLLGYQEKQILSSEIEACPVHMRTKLKTSYDILPKKLHK